ncbi:type VI secretion system baseplate subunit TssF, partial [Aliivibrio sifiae]
FRSQYTFTNNITVSLGVTACNGPLAQRLAIDSITQTTSQTTGSVEFTNIRAVTPCYTPPIEKDGLWSLISNMSLNYLSLTKPEAFKRILLAYDFAGQQDDAKGKKHQRLINGIENITTKPSDMLYEGAPVRAMNTHLQLNSKHFLCEGELYLFASVINEFLSLYTSINSFNQLNVTSTDGGDYSWQPRMGQQPLI